MPKAKTTSRRKGHATHESRSRGAVVRSSGPRGDAVSVRRVDSRSVRTPNRAAKAAEILDAAESLFAARPFHEVLLDDIAAKAHVGKGTVYLHYSSKEDVYLAVVRRGFDGVLGRIDAELPATEGRTWVQIEIIVASLVDFAFAHPRVFQLMRSGVVTPEDPGLIRTRARLTERIEGALRAGIARGDLHDPCPALTTQFVFSCVRGAALYPPKGMTRELLKGHILHLLRRGISGEAS